MKGLGELRDLELDKLAVEAEESYKNLDHICFSFGCFSKEHLMNNNMFWDQSMNDCKMINDITNILHTRLNLLNKVINKCRDFKRKIAMELR